MNKSCPVCGGQVNLVPSPRFGVGYYECIEAGRQACDRFFREDELVTIPVAIPAEWFVTDEVRAITNETWERALRMLTPPKHLLTGEGAGPLQRPVFITTARGGR